MDQTFRLAGASPASAVFPELEPAIGRAPTDAAPKTRVRHMFRLPARGLHPKQAPLGNVHSSVMNFRNIHEHGTLLAKYLEARKSIFIDSLRWNVSEAEGMEYDQYDTPACQWVVLHQFGEIVGGVRLLPTTAKCGIYTYMLRDAQRGLLDSIPTDVLFFEAPVRSKVWEASRFFIAETVPAARRLSVQHMLFESMARTAYQNGATSILGIVPAVWSRWARRIGAGATPVGPKFSIDGVASQPVLFNIRGYLS